jgi:prepilin peptidase dependent protein B
MRRRAVPRQRRQRGLSLVELLLGSALGLLLVGCGITVLLIQLRENRALVEHSRLMHDLRSASDLITRDLRRSGHWADAGAGVWTRGVTAANVAANPYAAVESTPSTVTLRYSLDSADNHQVDSHEQFGFRLRSGALEMRVGGANWQSMTDVTTMKVTALAFVPHSETLDLGALCSAPCATGDASCPPRQTLRSMVVTITAQSATDARTVRTARTAVRLRNDAITGRCPV